MGAANAPATITTIVRDLNRRRFENFYKILPKNSHDRNNQIATLVYHRRIISSPLDNDLKQQQVILGLPAPLPFQQQPQPQHCKKAK